MYFNSLSAMTDKLVLYAVLKKSIQIRYLSQYTLKIFKYM